MPIELIPLCTAVAHLKEPLLIPNGLTGVRVVAEVERFEMTGERLAAQVKGSTTADWMTLGPDMIGTLDVRAMFETHDGALVYCWYHGRLDLSNGPEGAHSYAAPLFETGDERYAWLNKIQAVAKGALSENSRRLDYEFYEVR
jgi:Protein of unknown function (DUF3237)